MSDFQRFTWVQASFNISITFNLSFEFCKNLKDNLLSLRFRGSGLRLLGIRAFIVFYKLSEKFLQDSIERLSKQLWKWFKLVFNKTLKIFLTSRRSVENNGRKQIKAKGGPGSRQKNVGHEDVANQNAGN